ncbi:MAG: ATP-binding protein [Verrucomicrobiales bacterium]|nr:ATP-binding protein [Verrucomicrobiales bacterium]
MKTTRQKSSVRKLAALRARLADAEEVVRAIRQGEVDAVMGAGKQDSQVFTLEGAEHAYRMLIESMNEGALTLTADKTILYANQCFARMVKCPLEQVTGSSFRRFLSEEDRATLRPLMKRSAKSGSKIPVLLHAGDGSLIPALLSIRELANEGSKDVIIGMVVTNMTEARRNEEMLRTLTHRVVQAQEAERRFVALELHDNITQLLCAVLVRSQALANKLSPHDGSAKREAVKLRELLGQTAEEVERISRNLRPSVLDELGLVAVLRDTSTEFAERTGVSVKLACVQLTARLPADTELALYRVLQEALKNVEKHASARHVTVYLTKLGDLVQLTIKDDGIGFNPDHHPARQKRKGGLGLLGMRERTTYVGGTLNVKSAPGKGTTILAQIPLIDRQPGGGGRRSRTNRVH